MSFVLNKCKNKNYYNVNIIKEINKKIGINLDENMIINKIKANSLAHENNINVNDKLIMINNINIKKINLNKGQVIALIKSTNNLNLCIERRKTTKVKRSTIKNSNTPKKKSQTKRSS
jgi:topoisomerase IA-like protein